MDAKEFIEKWNVGYEDLEQKEEFAKEMEADLKALQSSEWVKVELEKLKTDLEKLKAKRTYEVDVDSMICILRDILTPPNR
jgi:hypothetical protein